MRIMVLLSGDKPSTTAAVLLSDTNYDRCIELSQGLFTCACNLYPWIGNARAPRQRDASLSMADDQSQRDIHFIFKYDSPAIVVWLSTAFSSKSIIVASPVLVVTVSADLQC